MGHFGSRECSNEPLWDQRVGYLGLPISPLCRSESVPQINLLYAYLNGPVLQECDIRKSFLMKAGSSLRQHSVYHSNMQCFSVCTCMYVFMSS